VITYWPEFGQNGKDKITVADVCRHEGGLFKIPTLIKAKDLLTKNILKNKVGVHFEQAPLLIPVGNVRAYHMVS